MKKLMVLLVLLSAFTFGQTVFELNFGTLANSVTETQYQKIVGFTKVDSVCVSVIGTGEVDVDSVDIYVGYQSNAGQYYSTTANTFISTVDLAAGVKGFQNLSISNASIGTGLVRGMNALKVVTRGATAGNDATDPNNFRVLLFVYGQK
jgi:hypothetical protein